MERLRTYGRRAVTVPFYFLVGTIFVVGAPIWLPVCLLLDLVGSRRRSLTRFLSFFVGFFWSGCFGLIAATVCWLFKGGPFRGLPRRYLQQLYVIQRAWATSMLRWGMWLYNLRLEVRGLEKVLAKGGPFLLFSRHASFVDTMLPFPIFGRRGWRPRYVMKRELLWDPCIDIVGQQIPNYFVRRGSDDPEREVAGVVGLLEGLEPDNMVVFYPEGTRFTADKRARIIEKMRDRGDAAAAAAAESLTHVLPPRLGGSLGLLEHGTDCDVVFMGHIGLEKLTRINNLVDGSLLGNTLHVGLWREARAGMPTGHDALVDWLHARWQEMDAWVAEATAEDQGSSPALVGGQA